MAYSLCFLRQGTWTTKARDIKTLKCSLISLICSCVGNIMLAEIYDDNDIQYTVSLMKIAVLCQFTVASIKYMLYICG